MSFRPPRETVTRPRRREAVTTGCRTRLMSPRGKGPRPIDSHIITHRATEGKKISTVGGQRHSEKTYFFPTCRIERARSAQSATLCRQVSRAHALSSKPLYILDYPQTHRKARSSGHEKRFAARSQWRLRRGKNAPRASQLSMNRYVIGPERITKKMACQSIPLPLSKMRGSTSIVRLRFYAQGACSRRDDRPQGGGHRRPHRPAHG